MAPQPRVPWYRPAHTMLFVAEQRLRALDLDGEGLLVLEHQTLISLGASEVIDELERARERLAEDVESMEAVVKEAGAGGRNGGATAGAQRAAARWLDEDGDRLLRLVDRLEEIANVCSHGKYVIDEDAALRREADSDLEQLDRDDLAVVPPESVENAKRKGKSKWRLRIRRLFRRDRPSN
ncbi:hypothetical protein HU200_034347 [Digitaria exilis]|uniref:Uncharacterized protein n=1 Tax=Digitaria exilis TaxID=1010633 RepID=A0A835BHY0_9POAL|nr:hypothetical protein HU200_034347 [Digitaria exilis]